MVDRRSRVVAYCSVATKVALHVQPLPPLVCHVPSRMTAAVLYGSEDLRVEQIDVPALAVDVQSFNGIREFYLDRFEKWPGPALKSFTRVTIVDNAIYVEGEFDVKAAGDDLHSLNIAGKSVKSPCMILLECREGLLVGEIVYMDSGALTVS